MLYSRHHLTLHRLHTHTKQQATIIFRGINQKPASWKYKETPPHPTPSPACSVLPTHPASYCCSYNTLLWIGPLWALFSVVFWQRAFQGWLPEEGEAFKNSRICLFSDSLPIGLVLRLKKVDELFYFYNRAIYSFQESEHNAKQQAHGNIYNTPGVYGRSYHLIKESAGTIQVVRRASWLPASAKTRSKKSGRELPLCNHFLIPDIWYCFDFFFFFGQKLFPIFPSASCSPASLPPVALRNSSEVSFQEDALDSGHWEMTSPSRAPTAQSFSVRLSRKTISACEPVQQMCPFHYRREGLGGQGWQQ